MRSPRSATPLAAVALFACVAMSSCVREARPTPPARPIDAEGVASWYGPGLQGRRTANGEVFDKRQLTAAHRTLPFGTCVVVRNLANGNEVEVRVNDRGPYAGGRMIDVSEAAAQKLGMLETGVARVRIRACE